MQFAINVKPTNNPTWNGDVCVEMESWCEQNLSGKFEILGSYKLRFELEVDRDAFVAHYFSDEEGVTFDVN